MGIRVPYQEALRIGADDKPNPDFAKYYVLNFSQRGTQMAGDHRLCPSVIGNMSVQRLEEPLELIGDVLGLPPHGLGTGQIALACEAGDGAHVTTGRQSVAQTGGAANLGRESDSTEAEARAGHGAGGLRFADPPYKPQALISLRVRQA